MDLKKPPLFDLDQSSPWAAELQSIPHCDLPSALDVVGERWSFMILRAAFNGVQHFEDFLAVLGIARNILSNRLARLVEHGIFRREQLTDDRRKITYTLTDKGRDLLPTLLALRQWGEKYSNGPPPNPVLVDTRDRLPIAAIAIHAHDGRPLEWSDLHWQYREALGQRDDCC